MKPDKDIIFLVMLVAYAVIVWGFIGNKERTQKISALKIRIVDSTRNKFIGSAEIRHLFEQKKYSPFGRESYSVDLAGIERSLKTQQIVSKVEVFITEPGVLHVEINQKTPFVRIFNRLGQGYYLDRE
jgi:cell division septal protein FtsQ